MGQFEMIDYQKLKTSLEKLREVLHGAHLATTDYKCSSLLHLACHKIDEILSEIKP